jgi:hypothetical protein
MDLKKRFKGVKTMVDERIMTRFDSIRLEARAEGIAEAAWNLLKARVSKDVIVQTTGLTIADIEKQSKMISSSSPAAGN